MRVLITGITGFVGSHLADYLLNNEDVEVCGIVRWRSQKENIEHLEGKIKLFECNIKDMTSVHKVINTVKPERIFHLAAQSFVPASWSAPAETLSTNIIGELNIFESVKQMGFDSVIHIAGSSEEYGFVKPDEVPITEENPLRPLSPYGVSKVAQDLLGYQYFKSYGMKIIRTRAFNHTGPRRGEVFVCSNFAKQIAEIEKGKKNPVMLVGNLEAQRDFTDVRDIVKAYWLSTERCKPGEVYNICSGEPRTIQSILDTLLSFTDVKVEVKQDTERIRPSDVFVLAGDSSKFREKTDWKPEIPFDQTLRDTLSYWRERV
ncbi:GDP-mannose 4,6-dehydratase [candidate division WOR-3 bacterium]|nr:GDP-mannose 4,6-dehydratase [candidate division WOR-3 bacterium]